MLNRAQKYVHIMTPYLILDGELENALKYAAERGVDVRIILPGVPDKYIPFALALTHYRSLLESGVKIYEYTPASYMPRSLFVTTGRLLSAPLIWTTAASIITLNARPICGERTVSPRSKTILKRHRVNAGKSRWICSQQSHSSAGCWALLQKPLRRCCDRPREQMFKPRWIPMKGDPRRPLSRPLHHS